MVWTADVNSDWDDYGLTFMTKRDLTSYGFSDPIDIGEGLYVVERVSEEIGEMPACYEVAVFERVDRRYDVIAYVYWRVLYATDEHTVVTPVMVNVSPKFRGTDIPIGLYRWMLEKPGHIIQAGDITNKQSRGGASLWWKLYGDPSYQITASRGPLDTREVRTKRPRGGYPYLSTGSFDVYDTDAILRIRKKAS